MEGLVQDKAAGPEGGGAVWDSQNWKPERLRTGRGAEGPLSWSFREPESYGQ